MELKGAHSRCSIRKSVLPNPRTNAAKRVCQKGAGLPN
jgi:hypothetical protein